jgi:hypothetical protein
MERSYDPPEGHPETKMSDEETKLLDEYEYEYEF